MNPEGHEQLEAGGESHPGESVSGKVLNVYQKRAIKDLSEDEIVAKYAPLAIKMVHRIAPMAHSIVDFDDLKNVAFFALVQAIRSFQPEYGVAFEYHCKTRVRGAILDELRKTCSVSRTVYARWKKLEKAIQEVTEKWKRHPTEKEVAAHLGITLDAYRELLDELRLVAFVSLDELGAESRESGEGTPYQLVDLNQDDPSGQASTRDLQELIRNRILEMPSQQRKILALYYYEGLRLKDIAQLLQITESRVCQIHTEAILSLRAFIQRKESETIAY